MLKSLTLSQNLVQNGKADVNASNSDGVPLLIEAISRGDGFAAEFLLDNGCEVNVTSRKTGDSALHLIATYSESTTTDDRTYKDMLAVGIRLIDGGAKINIQNGRGYAPLHLAILSGHTDLIEKLLQRQDIDINLKTTDEKWPLQLALTKPFIGDGDFSLAKQMIEKGANVNCVYHETADNLLLYLIRKGEPESACFLADYANLNYVNKLGLTAIHLACEKGFLRVVERLLEKEALPNIQSTAMEYNSPLHFSVIANNLALIRIFVNFKHTKSDQDEEIFVPDFNLKNERGESPLSMALGLGHKELVPVLIEGGADLNARNGQDLTLLHQAILKEDAETAIFLLKNGADMNALTADQETPLQLAIHCRLPTVCEIS